MSPKNPLRDLTPTESDLDADATTQPDSGEKETLREKAAKTLHGPDANPSQLGDPISLKAETSDHNPKPEEAGAANSSSSTSPTPPRSTNPETSTLGKDSDHKTLREKATEKLHGPNANPSQLGDPISLKAEAAAGEHQREDVPAPGQGGPRGPTNPKSRL